MTPSEPASELEKLLQFELDVRQAAACLHKLGYGVSLRSVKKAYVNDQGKVSQEPTFEVFISMPRS